MITYLTIGAILLGLACATKTVQNVIQNVYAKYGFTLTIIFLITITVFYSALWPGALAYGIYTTTKGE